MNQKIPKHLAIVMDGNGRWAEDRGLERTHGHRGGLDAVQSVIKLCLEKGIEILSLFAFSRSNWGRPSSEVDFLMQLFVTALDSEVSNLHEHGVCIKFIGDINTLPEVLIEKMRIAENLTKDNRKLLLNIAINYTGKWDILTAIKNIITDVEAGCINVADLDESLFSLYLSTKTLPDPDLLIRTGGEQRISDFFLWQSAFTEFYFTEVKWPDFTKDEFLKALTSYSGRERRYGLISSQLKKASNNKKNKYV